MSFLSGLAHPLGLCRGGELCGLYSALAQDGKLVVEYILQVVGGLGIGKVGGGILPGWPCLGVGTQCLPTPTVSASSTYAAVSGV